MVSLEEQEKTLMFKRLELQKTKKELSKTIVELRTKIIAVKTPKKIKPSLLVLLKDKEQQREDIRKKIAKITEEIQDIRPKKKHLNYLNSFAYQKWGKRHRDFTLEEKKLYTRIMCKRNKLKKEGIDVGD